MELRAAAAAEASAIIDSASHSQRSIIAVPKFRLSTFRWKTTPVSKRSSLLSNESRTFDTRSSYSRPC